MSNTFNIKLQIPENWTAKTQQTAINKVTEMLFLQNKNNKSNVLIIAEKLKNKDIQSGYDYFKHISPSLGINDISDKEYIIAGKSFFSLENDIIINSEIQHQIHYAALENGYTILITGKYFDKENLKPIKNLIFSLQILNQ